MKPIRQEIFGEKKKSYSLFQNGGFWQLTLFLDESVRYDEEGSPLEYAYTLITLPPSTYDYASIVSAIINAKYDNDKMQAVVNNYLLDSDDLDNVVDFDNMQNYRAFAKRTAREINAEVVKFIDDYNKEHEPSNTDDNDEE